MKIFLFTCLSIHTRNIKYYYRAPMKCYLTLTILSVYSIITIVFETSLLFHLVERKLLGYFMPPTQSFLDGRVATIIFFHLWISPVCIPFLYWKEKTKHKVLDNLSWYTVQFSLLPIPSLKPLYKLKELKYFFYFLIRVPVILSMNRQDLVVYFTLAIAQSE